MTACLRSSPSPQFWREWGEPGSDPQAVLRFQACDWLPLIQTFAPPHAPRASLDRWFEITIATRRAQLSVVGSRLAAAPFDDRGGGGGWGQGESCPRNQTTGLVRAPSADHHGIAAGWSRARPRLPPMGGCFERWGDVWSARPGPLPAMWAWRRARRSRGVRLLGAASASSSWPALRASVRLCTSQSL